MANRANKEQLRRIAFSCGQYRYRGNNDLKSEADHFGETLRTCENCEHFNEEHKCNINLIDEILSNLAEVDYESEFDIE